MIYTILRLIFLIILIIILLLVLKKYCNLSLAKKLNRNFVINFKKRFIAIILIILTVALFIISIYPFEGHFIKFNSIDDSLNYKTVMSKNWENHFVKSEKSYFIFSVNRFASNVSYHSAHIEENGKIGLADFKTKKHYYSPFISNSNDRAINLIDCNAVYNEFSNETCYFVKVGLPKDETDHNVIIWDGDELNCIFYKKSVYGLYQIIRRGDFKKSINLVINNTNIQLRY